MSETDTHRKKSNDMLYAFLRDLREDVKGLDATVSRMTAKQGAQETDVARLQEQVAAMQRHIDEIDEHGTRSKSDGHDPVEPSGAWASLFNSQLAPWVLVALFLLSLAAMVLAATGHPLSEVNPMGGK